MPPSAACRDVTVPERKRKVGSILFKKNLKRELFFCGQKPQERQA